MTVLLRPMSPSRRHIAVQPNSVGWPVAELNYMYIIVQVLQRMWLSGCDHTEQLLVYRFLLIGSLATDSLQAITLQCFTLRCVSSEVCLPNESVGVVNPALV